MTDLTVRKHVKRSKSTRKFVNEMRSMSDVPTPARRFRVAPTFSGRMVVGRCRRSFGEVEVPRKGFRGRVLRRRDRAEVVCGGDLVLVANGHGRVRCSSCVARKRSRRHALMELQGLAQRLGERGVRAGRGWSPRRLFKRRAS